MATTKIWPVRDNLARVLEYAENHLKTANPDAYTAAELKDLHTVLDYAANSEKTAKQFYVTGINCIGEQAYQQMSETKMRFGKTDRNLAYHAYQSFAPNEVTPQDCHEIGKLLAKRLWGDRYEVVVSTHLNTHCVHNHFVINSVSFVDGEKFNNDFAMYFKRLRAESDRICLERGLSVIEKPGKSRNRWAEEAEKRGEPTRYNLYKQAIDRAIEGAMTQQQFQNILRLQGFELKLTGKHWTIKMTGNKRPTRLYQLGDNYTGEAIKQRILANMRPRIIIPAQKSPPKKYRLIGSFRTVRKLTGFRALYFYYLYRMGVLVKEKPRPPSNPILWEDVRKMRKISEQVRLLAKNTIDTSEQLQSFIGDTRNRMDELIRQRTAIQNKLRRAKEPEVIVALKAEKTALTEHIAPLRRSLTVAAEIEEWSSRIKEKLAVIRELELHEKQHQKMKQRSNAR